MIRQLEPSYIVLEEAAASDHSDELEVRTEKRASQLGVRELIDQGAEEEERG